MSERQPTKAGTSSWTTGGLVKHRCCTCGDVRWFVAELRNMMRHIGCRGVYVEAREEGPVRRGW